MCWVTGADGVEYSERVEQVGQRLAYFLGALRFLHDTDFDTAKVSLNSPII